MSKEISNQIQESMKLCVDLMKSPHYRKLGAEGIMAVVEKAKSIGISPLEALNGSLYYVQGKVEMTSALMNRLIRGGKHKHSITKDKRSNHTMCILHGKRADNGDTWVESFSIEDAKKAGIYRNQWLKYPKDMLFARALSRLARQLFPDLIMGCYVEGEISEIPLDPPAVEKVEDDEIKTITTEQYQELMKWMSPYSVLSQNILSFMKDKWGIDSLEDMPVEIYEQALNRAREQHKIEALGEHVQTKEVV